MIAKGFFLLFSVFQIFLETILIMNLEFDDIIDSASLFWGMGCKHGDKAFYFTIADTLDFPAKYIFSVVFFEQFHSMKLKYQNTRSVEIGQ